MARKNIENVYSLSPMAQGILFHALYDPRPGVYQVEVSWTLRGAIDRGAFDRAWQAVCDRHAVLRTGFAWEKLDKPLQIVRKRVDLPVAYHDLHALAPDEQQARIAAIREDLRRAFDLTRPPVLRLALVRIDEETHRFLWCSHHALLDGWSLPLLVREAFAIYEAEAGGRPLRLPPPRPYGDYIAWLSRQDLGAAEAFWRRELAGVGSPTPLGGERVSAPEEGFDVRAASIPEPEAAALQAFARAQQITMSTLVVGAWAILLARYSGEEVVVYGNTVSGRSAPVPGIESMVGLFINTLPVRVAVPRAARAIDWLRAFQDKLSELRDHEASPLLSVQGWSGLPRDVPLFESQVAFENFPAIEALREGGGGLRIVETRMASQAHYPLTFNASSQRTIGLRISYDRARFDRASIDRRLAHLRTLLASLARDPEMPLGQVSIVPDDERARLVALGRDARPAPAPATVHAIFQQQAARTPEDPALVAGDDRLSFRDLAARAHRLAHHLRRIGVGPDVTVGLCLPRTAGAVIGILGILAAGGAYVPLDPAHPPARLAQILAEAGARVVVTNAAIAPAVSGDGVEAVRLDADAAAIEKESDAAPPPISGPGNLAYVLFTSGSTGKPKGVAVEHRNLVRYVIGVADQLGLRPGARYAHVSTLSADLGNTVLFPPLCLGGTLHLVPEDLTTDPGALGATMDRERIDVLKIVPSHLSALLSGAHPERVLPRDLLVLGGEGSRWDLIDRVQRLAPSTRIVNHYGPTETTVGVITRAVDASARLPGHPIVPLGRPLPGARVHVVDPSIDLAPTGVAGEIVLGGAGVSRGYLGQPAITAERFVPDPFGAPGDRLYRTGDRGRMLDDGTVLFLGRADDQVKVRGHRVELGEIEAAIRMHPGVMEAVVLLHDDPHAGPRLTGYVVPEAVPGPSAAEIRQHLLGRLPDHFVPSGFVVLPALPLNANGKIDRRALAGLADQRAEDEPDAYVAPRGPVEEVIAGIWGDVFERDRIGVHDRFADLGGHSLIAIQIIARTRETFGVDVPLRAIFDAPTVAGLAREVEAAMREASSEAHDPPPPITPVPRDRPLVPSFAQERLWFLHLLDPQSDAYNVPWALRFAGRIDAAAMERALGAVVDRHEVLRTTFADEGGRIVQVIHAPGADPAALVPIPIVRWPDLAPAEREEEARKEAIAEARRPFDLRTGPLLRARILELAEDDHILCVTLHHAVSDGWTRAILQREIGVIYRALVDGRDARLPDLPIQYADYAAWQRRWLTGAVLDRQIAYWRQQLEGAPPAIDLPTDRPRPSVQSFRGGQRVKALGPEVARGLADLSRREGVTLYMTLLAALDVLLHRWTGQDDVVVGTSVSTRTHAETEQLVGFFINALVLRVRVDAEAPFTDLLARAKETCLGAYAHQDMPFERLVQELAPAPDPSRAPIFQVIFTMQNAPAAAMDLPGLSQRRLPWRAESHAVKYDLTFVMGETRDRGLFVSIEHNRDLFDPSTIDRMIGHLGTLLTGIAADARRKVADLPMTGREEERAVLVDWNAETSPEAAEACVHELFEDQADATPGAIALVALPERLTFADLDARANRLAHHLRRHGVTTESIVGLCLRRGPSMIVGMIAILKAGGAYLPIDPAYPPRRVADLIQAAGVRVVVGEDRDGASLPSGVTVVRLDVDAEAIDRERSDRVGAPVAPGNLAYVLFTSGSTGTPKGVGVEHRNLVSYVRAVASRLALPAGASYAHVSTFSADLGHTVLFPPLCQGGTLHVIPEALTTDAHGIGAYFDEHGVDCLKIVPSHLAALLSGAHPERVLPRKLLVLGGEGARWELVERIHELSASLRILNHYGPTETTVGATTHAVERGVRTPGTAIVPIGRPLPDVQVYVLDASRRTAPIGVPGEVYIAGAGVARGYVGLPDLTRDRFLPDPFSGRPGARMYRTGDRARWLPDGTLIFLGRADAQVKIRGFRVELGEIEATLALHPGVDAAVVLARDDGAGALRLAAFVVPSPPGGVTVESLRAHLEDRLPEAFSPSSITILDALPLTPNGKIDRRALVERQVAAPADETGEAPRTPIEEVLASIWADVFGRDRVGVHERFADLGGHSLLAIQIIARARDALQADVPLRAIFEAPTVAALAERVEAILREGTGIDGTPLLRTARAGDVPLSFAQERLWFLHQLEPESAAYNIPIRLRLRGALDVAALARSIGAIVDRHEVLRTTIATVGGQPVGVVRDRLEVRLVPEDTGGEDAARAVAAADAEAPFDLGAGPLFRARLLRLGPEDHVLLLTMHHLVSDAWSRGILYRELGALYEAHRAGRASSLAELPVQYADFAAWQRKFLAGDVLDRQVAYWRDQLAGAPAAIDLPTDRPRPPVLSPRGGRRRVTVDGATVAALSALARREGATLFMTVLAAFDALLHRMTGQTDVVVGTPIAGRSRPEIEPLVGFFVNTLPIRVAVDPDASFLDLVARVRERCLGAYAHQDLPFERMVTELAPARDLGRTPVFQVVFTLQLQAAGAGALSLPGLAVSPLAGDGTTSKFDLTLGLGADGRGGLSGSLEYNADLFGPATADRIAARFEALLAGVAAQPEAPIWRLPVMLAEEARRVVVEWNDTARDRAPEGLIHERFARTAERTPDAVALWFEDAALSYGELHARVAALARRLRRLGVGPEAIVGVCLDRSLDMVVALQAVLAAGGAYLPLDPELPQDRLAFMIADARPAVILAGAQVASRLPEQAGSVIVLGAPSPAPGDAPDPPPIAPGPSNLAYVIFTSGSTGRPKGAMNEHGAILNRLLWMQEALGLEPSDRILQKTPFGFDVSVWELFCPLMFGSSIVIASPGGHRDPAYLIGAVADQGVTTLHFVPSMLGPFLDAVEALGALARRRLGALRRVVCSGEALPGALAARFTALLPGVELHNLYGPTEAAVDVTASRVLPGSTTVSIGKPIDNTRIYVLDGRLSPAPISVRGDLYIGGVQVGRGYLARPDLTADRFVPDPFAGAPGARMYRTGDLARWLPSGEIDYLGRADFQIKLRGFRIELGEIEATILVHPGVREAVVTLARGGSGEARLAAYLVGGTAPAPSVVDLRAFLASRLPEHMIPWDFVWLPALPLTSSGKVDRRALPAPGAAERAALGEDFVAPRGGVEEALARIWAEVLRRDDIGARDNFFAIGGDSILSIQIVSRAQAAGIHVTPRQIFQHQTIAELAAVAGGASGTQADQSPVVGPVPLAPIQRWWLEAYPDAPDRFHQSLFLEVAEPLQRSALDAALSAIVDHHDMLRVRLAREGGSWVQVCAAPGEPVHVLEADLGDVPDAALAAALETEVERAHASIQLAGGPAFAALHVRLGGARGERLLLVAHHLAVDAVSWRILGEDLRAAHAAARSGARIALPPRTTSFRSWAEALQDRARSAEIARERAHWIAAGRASVRVPVDHPGVEDREASTRSVVVALDATATTRLVRDVPAAYGTQINDVLLTALALGFLRWAGASSGAERAMLLDLEGHGREDLSSNVDVTRTVGWFTALFPVRLELPAVGSQSAALGDLLRSVKEQLRAVPGRGLGFGLLRYLGGDPGLREELAATIRPEVRFNYLGQLDAGGGDDAMFRRAREPAGSPIDPRARRLYALDVLASIADGRLRLRFAYGAERHERATVERLAAGVLGALSAIIEHATSPDAGGYTPSDFPLASLDQAAVDRLAARAGGPRSLEDVYPLSPLQEGILFDTLYAEDPGAYVVQLAWTLTGALDTAAFARAWQAVVDRHTPLRTSVVWQGLDRPLQLVHRRAALPITERDLRALSAPEQQEEVERFTADDRRAGFDLERPPLVRIALLQLGDERFHFVWSAHHVVLDGWSMPILLREALRVYGSREGSGRVSLDAPRPYREYVAWLARQAPDRAAQYWRAQLGDVTAPTAIAGEDRRPAVPRTGRHDERHVRLGAGVSARLAAFTKDHRLTMSTLVQGAWALLLSRYSGESRVVFGVTLSGRSAPIQGIDRMIGMFINTLPVRVEIHPDATPVAFLAALQDMQTELREHEHDALGLAQSLSGVPRGTPLFESLVVFENQPLDDGGPAAGDRHGSLKLNDARAVEGAAYPLTLQSSFRKDLFVRIRFDAGRLDGALIERMIGHLTTIVESFAAAPGEPIRRISLLTAAEQARVLQWNDTSLRHEVDLPVPRIIAAQARRTPEAIAVSFEGRTLRYGELDNRADRLATLLRARGVRAEVIVAVAMERSLEMVVALYGTLKAGGAYLPLDPEYPTARLDHMIADARPAVVLTQARFAARLTGAARDVAVIALDADGPLADTEPGAPATVDGPAPDQLAYVIYTSGSTGRPKGAMNTHRALANRLLWMQRSHPLSPSDRVLQKTPFTFDVSVWELFWPLMVGARLVMARPGGHRDPQYLADTIAAEGVTTLHFVPSMLSAFLDGAEVGRCEPLRHVFASGEALAPALADRVFAALPGVALHNLYGPTEAAVDVSSWTCTPGDGVIPIGRPVDNTRLYVLDPAGNLVPVGVRGELYIAGVQVGRGYLKQPALTADRFVPDPFSADPGARMYRTGDVARWLPSGAVEYLGRVDFQVKIRGHRIELGEVEAALLAHPAIRDAVVTARGDGGDRRLVAYVTWTREAAARDASSAAPPTVQELRAFLAERLPEHMVPSAFVSLGALPLTASGKVDRRALPAPEEASGPERSTSHVEPSGPVQEALARIWAAVLRLRRVGADDNFFELGGDSILSIQIVSRAGQEGIVITPRQIFEHPTIAGLAREARVGRIAPAEQGPVTGAVPLTPVQRWWLELGCAEPSHWNQSRFLATRAPLDAGAMERAVARIFEHHDALRLRLRRTGDGLAQAIAPPSGAPPFRRVDLTGVADAERATAVEAACDAAQRSLDLAEGPVARVLLLDLSAAGQRLLFVAHHLAVDGVSWRILLEDLWSAYDQELRGARAVLPAKTTSFKRWAEALADHARSAGVERELERWAGLAQGDAPIPVDHEGAADEGSTRTVVGSLDAHETEQLLREVPEAYRTQINDVLLTALALALSPWTGARHARVDVEGHGREEIFGDVDLTRTVGWFTVVYPVVLRLPADEDLGAALKAVKEQLRGVPARGLGWGLLRYLREGDPIAARLLQVPPSAVSFNYLGQMDRTLPDAAPFRWAPEPSGRPRSPSAPRRYLIDVNAWVSAGRLHASFGYSQGRHRRETIASLSERFVGALRALVAHCVSPAARGLTPSDVQGADLSQEALDMLVDMVSGDDP